jgi:hypothetical protein
MPSIQLKVVPAGGSEWLSFQSMQSYENIQLY